VAGESAEQTVEVIVSGWTRHARLRFDVFGPVAGSGFDRSIRERHEPGHGELQYQQRRGEERPAPEARSSGEERPAPEARSSGEERPLGDVRSVGQNGPSPGRHRLRGRVP
jgi:hypothetical protein